MLFHISFYDYYFVNIKLMVVYFMSVIVFGKVCIIDFYPEFTNYNIDLTIYIYISVMLANFFSMLRSLSNIMS